MTNGRFESDTRIALKKPDFFFGDAITEHDRVLYDRDYKWLRQIGDRRFFLSNMERMYPFAYLQHTSIRRTMEWDLSKSISVMSLGKVGVNEAYPAGHGRDIFGLHPGLISAEYPTGETPQLAATFINQFLKVRGDFPTDFRPLGWVHSSDKSWWGKMVGFVLTELGDLLKQARLYHAVRVVQHGVPQSSHHFYGILERYNPLTGTFFTLVGEMGLFMSYTRFRG